MAHNKMYKTLPSQFRRGGGGGAEGVGNGNDRAPQEISAPSTDVHADEKMYQQLAAEKDEVARKEVEKMRIESKKMVDRYLDQSRRREDQLKWKEDERASLERRNQAVVRLQYEERERKERLRKDEMLREAALMKKTRLREREDGDRRKLEQQGLERQTNFERMRAEELARRDFERMRADELARIERMRAEELARREAAAGQRREKKEEQEQRQPAAPQHHHHGGQLFGLNLNLSNLISGGMNFFGHFRRGAAAAAAAPKTPSDGGGDAPSPVSSTSSPNIIGSPDVSEHSSSSVSSVESVSFVVGGAGGVGFGSSAAAAEEHIEMRCFPLDAANDGQTGAGHAFITVSTFSPTWCDLCGDLIWGLYDTGAMACAHCRYTCHIKCATKVRLNCVSVQPAAAAAPASSARRRSSAGSSTHARIDDGPDAVDDSDEEELATLNDVETIRDEDDDDDDDAEYKTLRSSDFEDLKLDIGRVSPSGLLLRRRRSGSADGPDRGGAATATRPDCGAATTATRADRGATTATRPSVGPLPFGAYSPDELAQIVADYSAQCPAGQQATLDDQDGSGQRFRGFIRVRMNLRRPINVIAGTRPPSVYNIMKEDTLNERTLTSFYLPPNTEKALHIGDATTVRDVIRSLLAKFKVADNPHKYALYEERVCADDGSAAANAHDGDGTHGRNATDRQQSRSSFGRGPQLRRLPDDDRPLITAIAWNRRDQNATAAQDKLSFVLQENDPGECVTWDFFSAPELSNFLVILDREEAWYKKQIHVKYEIIHNHMLQLAALRKAQEEEVAAAAAAAAAESFLETHF